MHREFDTVAKHFVEAASRCRGLEVRRDVAGPRHAAGQHRLGRGSLTSPATRVAKRWKRGAVGQATTIFERHEDIGIWPRVMDSERRQSRSLTSR